MPYESSAQLLRQIPLDDWLDDAARPGALGRLNSSALSVARAGGTLVRRFPWVGRGLSLLRGGSAIGWASIGLELALAWLNDNADDMNQETGSNLALGVFGAYPQPTTVTFTTTFAYEDAINGMQTIFSTDVDVINSVLSIVHPPIIQAESSNRQSVSFRIQTVTQQAIPRLERAGVSNGGGAVLLDRNRYRNLRVISFTAVPSPSNTPLIYEPYPSPLPNALPATLPRPLILPSPALLPVTSPPLLLPAYPGEIIIHTPETERRRRPAIPSPPGRIDIDWIPNTPTVPTYPPTYPPTDPRPPVRLPPGLRVRFLPEVVQIIQLITEIATETDPCEELLRRRNDGDDCPDPCPELDYERIQRIVEGYANRLGDGRNTPSLTDGNWTAYGDEVSISLDENVRFIEYSFDVSAYTGGTTVSAEAPNQAFCGLYAFDSGEKEGLDFYEGKIPKIPGAGTFWAQCRNGAKIRVRRLSIPPLAFPIE